MTTTEDRAGMDRRIAAPPTMAVLAAEALRSMILSGELMPGDRLPEIRLTAQLGGQPDLRQPVAGHELTAQDNRSERFRGEDGHGRGGGDSSVHASSILRCRHGSPSRTVRNRDRVTGMPLHSTRPEQLAIASCPSSSGVT